MMNKTSR